MICKNCGKELNESAEYCNECGTKLEIENAADNVIEKFQNLNKSSNLIKNKKKIIIIGTIIVLVIAVIFYIVSINSGSDDTDAYDNNDYNAAENYEDDFGNNEYVTAAETEPITAKTSNIKFEYPESTMYYTTAYGEKLGFKISTVKQAITADGDIHYQIEAEVVSKELTEDHHPNALEDGFYSCWLICDYYDANGIIIGDEWVIEKIPVDDPIGTKYNLGSVTIYDWKYDEDIEKIVIREKR